MLSSCYTPILLYLSLCCLTSLVVEADGNSYWVIPPPPNPSDKPDNNQQSISPENKQQSISAWYQFGTNVNYRITAILDVNGGSAGSPNFEEVTNKDAKPNTKFDDDTSKSKQNVKTPGYSIPVSVITIFNPQTKTYQQRISYYSDKQIDYNVNGQTYKVIDNPYTGKRRTAERVHDPNRRVCFPTGGNSTNKVGYLNFFPTVEQMKHYTLGKLVTSEPGVPYRVASLESTHGTYNATTEYSQSDASYEDHQGMPTNDWYQFTYEESLSSSSSIDGDTPGSSKGGIPSRPIKWTMLSRNQIINAHTEDWVIRYLSYEPIDSTEEELWKNYFDLSYKKDCSRGQLSSLLDDDRDGSHRMLKGTNRLGMFFSSSASQHSDADRASTSSSPLTKPSQFDIYLAKHNKHYPHGSPEYEKRKVIHETNSNNIKKWNKEHDGKTTFVSNELMDLNVKEVMSFRGGHIPPPNLELGSKVTNSLRKSSSNFLLDQLGKDPKPFTTHQVPQNFNPSSLPETFDWREHLPGSVGAIKDQGFCGSCWAFSFVSAVESHWFIKHGQTVVLPEQFINDCSWSEGTHGCDGGDSGWAAKQMIERFGGMIPTREAYGGYLSVDAGCYVDILQDMGMTSGNSLNDLASSTPTSNMVQLTDWVVVPARDEIAFKHALYTQGPLSIAVNVVDEAMYYSSGVLDVESCSANDASHLDHAITVIGWGTDVLSDGSVGEHWIVRNSWSDLWGDQGYFKIRMGDKDCGVTTAGGYPVVASKRELIDDVATA